MCNKCISCSVPVSVPTNAAKIKFPDVDRLNKGTIRWLLVRRSGSATLKDINGDTLAADTVINTAHLTLMTKNGGETLVIPLSSLQRDYNAPEPQCVQLPAIASNSSFIQLDTSAADYDTSHVIEIIFGIDCPPEIC